MAEAWRAAGFRPTTWCIPWVLALAVVACQSPPNGSKSPRRLGAGQPSALPSAAASPAPALKLRARQVSDGVAIQLQGEVRLISDHGGGIVSNHSSGLISDQGGGLISDHGGGIVSNHSSGIVSNHSSGWRLLGLGLAQAEVGASSPQEARLSEAQVVLFDLQGQALVHPNGQPIAAMTDAQGRYRLEGMVPQGEALVARVALPKQGLLRALILPGQKGTRDLDTASTLGSSYLLDDMLVGQRNLLAKLPVEELVRLDEAASVARLRLGREVPSYGLDESLSIAKRLKQSDAGFDRQLERIRSLLLAGQENLGAGRLATEVSLTLPAGLWLRADGAIEILERLDRRVRRVEKDGRISNFSLTGPAREQPTTITAVLPDGQDGLWLADRGSHRVWHVNAQREARVVLGAPEAAGGVPGPGVQAQIVAPANLALAPAGGLYVSEGLPGARLLHLKADGQVEAIAPPVALGANESIQGLGLASWPDGRLVWAFQVVQAAVGRPQVLRVAVWPRDAQGQWAAAPWPLPSGWELGGALLMGCWLAQADGQVAIARVHMNDVWRLKAQGQAQVLAGQSGKAGNSGDGGPALQALLNGPCDLAIDEQGRLLVVEQGSGLVRRIETDGRFTRIAGIPSGGALVEGQGGVAINGPLGVAVDAAGGILFTEGGGGQIQRIVNGEVQPFAGSQPGFGGDGGPALQAQFDGPTGVAHDPKTGRTFVLDGENRRVRLIEPNGTVRTVAGAGSRMMTTPENVVAMPSGDWLPQHLAAIAIDPLGRPCIADVRSNVVVRLQAQGSDPYALAVPIAGVGGKGKPDASNEPDRAATATPLAIPTALAFDREGRLLIASAGNFVLYRLENNGILARIAGPKWSTMLPLLLHGSDLTDPEGVQAADARFQAMVSLAVDPEGRILVGEGGAARLQDLINNTGLNMLKVGGQGGARVRRIEADGRVITLLGMGGRALKDAEGEESLRYPSALAFDADGRLILADMLRNQLRLIPKAALSP